MGSLLPTLGSPPWRPHALCTAGPPVATQTATLTIMKSGHATDLIAIEEMVEEIDSLLKSPLIRRPTKGKTTRRTAVKDSVKDRVKDKV